MTCCRSAPSRGRRFSGATAQAPSAATAAPCAWCSARARTGSRPIAVAALTTARWTVRQDSNRIGIRLDGPRLHRVRTGELPSEPTLPGALQVPPDGRPILLGPDAPVTGGYPVIAVVRDGDLDAAAQLGRGRGHLQLSVHVNGLHRHVTTVDGQLNLPGREVARRS